jgi:hypothetical protein
MPGIDSAGETAEKVVPLVRFPILMRVVFPGICAVALLFPFTGWPLSRFEFADWEGLEEHAIPALGICAAVFLIGALIAALNGEIYKIYEGRTFWPASLRFRGIQRQQARIDRLQRYAAYQRSDDPHLENLRRESWDELRTYPIDDEGKYYADKPTRLGNILAGYEQYPKTRYNMSGIFYFTRIWLEMEKEKKEDIDSFWAIADGFLALSAVFAVGGLLWIAIAIFHWFGWIATPVPLAEPGISVLLGLLWIGLSYSLYRLSLPFHLQNGELFKSMFDLYRDKVWQMTKLQEDELTVWNRAWLHYQYRRTKCTQCGNQGSAENPVLPQTPCPYCGNVNPAFR